MAPPRQIHLIRHAQGIHNTDPKYHVVVDPELTPWGIRQCRILAKDFAPSPDRIALLAASPLRRTLETASHIFEKQKFKILAVPDAQEVGDFPCDYGSPLAKLTAELAPKLAAEHNTPVDLSLVEDGWQLKTGRYGTDRKAIEERARDLRLWLRQKCNDLEGDGDIILVTHGGFLHFLTEDWSDFKPLAGTGWANTEHRTYQILDAADPNASMTETEESKRRRQGSPRPDRTEYIKLKEKNLIKQHQKAVKSNV